MRGSAVLADAANAVLLGSIPVERKFAIGVAGLLAGHIARGAWVRRRGARRRAAAYDVFDRGSGRPVEVDAHRPADARLAVIFSNGLGSPHEQWTWVCAHLPDDVAYLKYNRPAPTRDGGVDEQFALLDRLRDHYLGDLPVVVVGHSLGGYLAAAYAARRPAAGISHVVLVDATNIDDLVRARGSKTDVWTRQQLVMELAWAALGFNVTRPMSRWRDSYPAEVRAAMTEFHARPGVWAATLREYRQAFSWPAVGRLSVPLHVVTAVNGLPDTRAHAASQRGLLELSDRSTQHHLEETDHEQVLSDETNAKAVAALVLNGGAA
ncbi:MAG: alpha/beta fold hydrolase [Saccharothrix sp.]|nr:alpha/beta fold hydrolase [Saccharothrix sp.]